MNVASAVRRHENTTTADATRASARGNNNLRQVSPVLSPPPGNQFFVENIP